MQLSYRSANVGEEHHVIHYLTNCHSRIVDQHQVCRQYDDEHGAYLLQKALQSRKEITLFAGAQLQVSHHILHASLSLALYLLAVKRLNDIDTLYGIQDILVHRLLSFVDAASSGPHPFCLYIGYIEVYRHYCQRHNAHIHIGQKHQHQGYDGTRK